MINKTLYRRLKELFGEVKIYNPDSPARGRVTRCPVSGRLKMSLSSVGEQYAVCCPFCSDTRHRLVISHLWGKTIAELGHPVYLAKCWNETDCLSSTENTDMLKNYIDESGVLANVTLDIDESACDSDRRDFEATWPDGVKPISQLPAGHKAVTWLREERKFDPDRVTRLWDIRYCDSEYSGMASHRIIIPVYEGGVLRGWQARRVGDDEGSSNPKYWNCPGMSRSRLLYNLDRASKRRMLVLVEGPMDAWRVGLCGVAALGCKVSSQIRLLLDAAGSTKPIIVMLDPEEMVKPETMRFVNELRLRAPAGAFPVVLPFGTDPGSTSRKDLHMFIARALRHEKSSVDVG